MFVSIIGYWVDKKNITEIYGFSLLFFLLSLEDREREKGKEISLVHAYIEAPSRTF